MEIRRSIRCLSTASIFIAGCCCPSLDLAVCDADVAEESRAEARDALETLLRGDPVSKREAVEDAGSTFRFLDDVDCEDSTFREVLGALDRIARTETDDWVASRLLQNLGELETECLNSLYLHALKSRSPNVRWRAIQWFADHQSVEAVPLLEHEWRTEKRPWVRIDLMGALAENRAVGIASDLVDVAENGSSSLSRAAFGAIQTLADAGMVPDLARLAREGKDRVRAGAVSTLAAWPDSDEALTAVLEATNADAAVVRERAIDAMGQFSSPRAVKRLIELAGSGNRVADRSAALGTLGNLQAPEAIPVLADLLRESLPEGSPDLHGKAISILLQLDDPVAVPLLRDLDPELKGQGHFNLRFLIQFLSRDRTGEEGKTADVRTSCGVDQAENDPDNPTDFVVVPPDERLTIRCWEFPGIAGDPEDFERIPGGSRAHGEDHFEGEDDSWIQIDTPESSEYCWAPQSLLQPVTAEGDPAGPVKPPGRSEFDLPEQEYLGEAARILTEGGLLKAFEPGEAILGVSLEVEAGDDEGLTLLRESCRGDDSILDGMVQEMLEGLGSACSDLRPEASPDDSDEDSSLPPADD